MGQSIKKPLKKDKDGNIILKEPIVKKYSAILLLVMAVALLIGSLYLLITGIITAVNIIRIVISVLILIFAVWTIRKREVYIITKEKIVSFGSWEIFFKDIDTVTVNKLKFIKILVITSGNEEFSIEQSSVSVPLEYVAEYLAKKLKKK